MILITGCTGYIGRRLTCAFLAAGVAVRGLVLPQECEHARDLVSLGMDIWIGDILIPETLRGITDAVTLIYHCVGGHFASLQHMQNIYVQGVQNLISCCNETSLQACLIASNGAVYGNSGDRYLDEGCLPTPDHPFGQITLEMEQLVLQAYLKDRFPGIIVRIAEVYGAGEYNLVKQVGKSPSLRLLGDGFNWTSHIHIDDLIAILQAAPSYLQVGEVYNVVDDLPLQQRELYTRLAQIAAVSPPDWLSQSDIPERIRLSIHGLRALSLRLSNAKLKSQFPVALQYPTCWEGIQALMETSIKV